MIVRLICLVVGHRWYPARDGISSRTLPGGGGAFRVHTVECERCHQRRYAPTPPTDSEQS